MKFFWAEQNPEKAVSMERFKTVHLTKQTRSSPWKEKQVQFLRILISRNNGSVTLTFGDPVGLAHGDRATPFWIRSSRGGTGGRLRWGICRGSGSGFLLCARGEDPGEVTGEFCLSLHFRREKIKLPFTWWSSIQLPFPN